MKGLKDLMTQDDWNDLVKGSVITNGVHLYMVDGFAQNTIYDNVHEAHYNADHLVSVHCIDSRSINRPSMIRDTCAFEGWSANTDDNLPCKEYKFNVSIRFNGNVKLMAKTKEEAKKYIKEVLQGRLVLCDLHDTNFTDWSIKNEPEIMISE